MTKIEIDLRDLGLPTGQDHEGEPYGSTTLTDLVVSAAVDQLLRNQKALRDEVRDKVNAAITKEIDENVKKMVLEAFEAPIQRTTFLGEKQGEETTVRELIRKSIESYVKAPASSDRYSNSTKNLQELIDASTKNLLDKDFTEYLKQVKEGVRVSVHQKALDAAVAFLQK